MSPPRIRPHNDLTALEIEGLEDKLYEHNRVATGKDDGRWLAFFAEDEGGEMIGAAAGYSWAGISELKQMWVDEHHRGKGLGRALVEAFVAEAAARGCKSIFLATYDFQAPWLYETCGFTRVAAIEDFPLGHTNYFYRRDL